MIPLKHSNLTTVGQTYHHFQLTKSTEISELNCHLYELIHLPTGAQVMHLANDDPENLFCLSFQTLPHKSDGVAHILEHTVLCGSQKFPVKDPFFAMTRRSLNTFMNALTGSDFTCYPAASQVPKDFYNLLEVYLDAVFHPNLDFLSFLQEGRRLEFAIPHDPSSPLEYKGIVFNEMKGALASSTTRLSEALHEALFPDITYGINAGGTPSGIAELTYEELLNFHQIFYHPSHCLFFFYGNLPLEQHLDFIQQQALNNVDQAKELPLIPLQPRFSQPKYLSLPYPLSSSEDNEEKALIAFGWLTCHITEQEELLALNILEIVLLDTDASPLKKALLRSGFCKLVSSHIDTDMSESPLIIMLKGCNLQDADACEQLIRTTLEEIALQGIPLEKLENAIHQLEFYRSEITGDHSPFGLSLFMRSALLKQHGVEPEKGLRIHSLFEVIHQRVLQDPTYFSRLIKKHLLTNPHFVRLILYPDRELANEELKSEREKLEKLKENLSSLEKQQLIEQFDKLTHFQKKQEEEDSDILPKITLADVPREARNFALTQKKSGALTVFHHDCFTNKIVYASLIFNLPFLTFEELTYVRLLTYLMPQIGAGNRNYSQNLDYIQAHTGGVGVSLSLNLQAQDHTLFYPYLTIHGKALDYQAHKLFPLLYDLATSIDLDDLDRLSEVLHKHYTALESSLNQNSMQYAINLSASNLDIPSKIANEWYGLHYFSKIGFIVHHLPQELPNLVVKLKSLKSKLLCANQADLVISSDQAIYEELQIKQFYGLTDLPLSSYQPWQNHFTLEPVESQGRVISSPVAFTGKVFKTISFVHHDAPALGVAACLFDNLVLHTRIRERGGAYGGGAVSNAISGNFYFYAYRDPTIATTLEAFEEAVREVVEGNFDQGDLEEAKIEIIQSLDDPVAPGSRALHAYSWHREGKTTEVRQAFRDCLLKLTCQDVIKAVREHIAPQLANGSTIVFANRELLDRENKKLDPPLPIYSI